MSDSNGGLISGVAGLTAIFGFAAGWMATGAFIPAVLIGVVTGFSARIGSGLGAVGGGLAGGLLGSLAGRNGAEAGVALGAISGAAIGFVALAMAGYGYTKDAFVNYENPPAPAPVMDTIPDNTQSMFQERNILGKPAVEIAAHKAPTPKMA